MKYLFPFSLAIGMAVAQPTDPGEPPVKAPFGKKEDSLCINDWWNQPAKAELGPLYKVDI